MSELWIPGQNQPAAKPVVSTTFQQAKGIQLVSNTDEHGQVDGLAIAFPHEGLALVIKNPQLLEQFAQAMAQVAVTIRSRQFKIVTSKN